MFFYVLLTGFCRQIWPVALVHVVVFMLWSLVFLDLYGFVALGLCCCIGPLPIARCCYAISCVLALCLETRGGLFCSTAAASSSMA